MTEELKSLKVGLVMPIASIDGCSAEHWVDIKRIITESTSSIEGYDCDTKIVSEGDSVGLIHKRIVEGLYKSDIVICDVSCKNPNVMFELGMRLAFDKPTVIIKDDKTNYSFDTGGIEHIEYPRDLRFTKIVEFKSQLSKKVIATFEDSLRDPDHSPFLKSFGPFKAATLNETTVTPDQFIIETLQDMQNDIASIKRNSQPPKIDAVNKGVHSIMKKLEKEVVETSILKYLEQKTPEEIQQGVPIRELFVFTQDNLLRYDLEFTDKQVVEKIAHFLTSKGISFTNN